MTGKSKPKNKNKFKKIKRFDHKLAAKIKETHMICPYRHGTQMFPDKYTAIGRINFNEAVSIPGTAGVQAKYFVTMYANQCTNSNGPSINNNGAGFGSFTNNVPAGLQYLLGDGNAGTAGIGGQAPYLKYRVTQSTIVVSYTPDNIANNANSTLIVFPYNAGTALAGAWQSMQLSQLQEQPYAKTINLPSYSTTKASKIVIKMPTLTICGDAFKSTIENGSFDGTYNTNPSNLWMWGVAIYTTYSNLNSYALYGTLSVDQYQKIDFFSRNTYQSSVPN